MIVNRTQEIKEVKCDSLILTGKFRSYSPLIDHTVIGYDPATFGPFVDMNLMTSVPGIFAAGMYCVVLKCTICVLLKVSAPHRALLDI